MSHGLFSLSRLSLTYVGRNGDGELDFISLKFFTSAHEGQKMFVFIQTNVSNILCSKILSSNSAVPKVGVRTPRGSQDTEGGYEMPSKEQIHF